jgi:chromate transporter
VSPDQNPGRIARGASAEALTAETAHDHSVNALRPVTLARLSLYFLKLGTVGFGGPIALAGAMQNALVEERRWVSREEYLDGLAFAQLAPGPLAAQLAMYLGYVRAGIWGATLVGLAFILPSFALVWALAVSYVRLGGLWWMQALFYGIGACVIGIIAKSVTRLARLTLGSDRLLWGIAGILAMTTAWTGRENVALLVLGGVASTVRPSLHRTGLLAMMVPGGLATAAIGGPTVVSLASLGWFFTAAGASVFGSGLAIVPFLHSGVVLERHWLTERQFLDAVAVAMVTPGPVVITVAFIGYLVRGVPGMAVAAAGVFLPVYLFIVVLAPWFGRWRARAGVKTFVSGVTAAATGAIAGAVLTLGRRAIVDLPTVTIVVSTYLVLWRWRVSELWLIGASAVTGICLRWS